jgi:hypothetical protein
MSCYDESVRPYSPKVNKEFSVIIQVFMVAFSYPYVSVIDFTY